MILENRDKRKRHVAFLGVIQHYGSMVVRKQTLTLCLLVLAGFILAPAVALADHSASTNYQVNETFFGSGGNLNSCSNSYCTKQSAGETTVGNTKSTNFQANAGFNTDRQPYIEIDVSSTNVNLGNLSTGTTSFVNATFSVKSYLAHGYTVVNASNPPTNGTYIMQNLTTPTAPAAGTEQFGINLVANTVPTTFGANPVQEPDSSFGFGTVTSDYSNPNLFKYLKGDIIAQSASSTSATNYTISYIFNISHVTPGGVYEFHHVLVATATY